MSVKVCKICKVNFKSRFRIGINRYDFRGRRHCYNCKKLKIKTKNSELEKYILDMKYLEIEPQTIKANQNNPKNRPCKYCQQNLIRYNNSKFSNVCKKCQYIFKKIKNKLFCFNFKGGACNDCGWKPACLEDLACLDFHHIDPSTKDYEISEIESASFKTIQIELEKCIMLCAICHRKKHVTKYNPEIANDALKATGYEVPF